MFIPTENVEAFGQVRVFSLVPVLASGRHPALCCLCAGAEPSEVSRQPSERDQWGAV